MGRPFGAKGKCDPRGPLLDQLDDPEDRSNRNRSIHATPAYRAISPPMRFGAFAAIMTGLIIRDIGKSVENVGVSIENISDRIGLSTGALGFFNDGRNDF